MCLKLVVKNFNKKLGLVENCCYFFHILQSIIDVCQNSEYTSVICYSLFGKIEDASKFDLVAMEVYSF